MAAREARGWQDIQEQEPPSIVEDVTLDEAILFLQEVVTKERWHGSITFNFKDGEFLQMESRRLVKARRRDSPPKK